MKTFWREAALGAVAVMALRAAEPVRLEGRAMGTTWAVAYEATTALPGGETSTAVLTRKVAERLEALEAIFSTYRGASEVMRFNAAEAGQWIEVSRELAEIARGSAQVAAATGGAFDGTVGPLLVVWGVGANRERPAPTAEEIGAARARVGFRKLEVRPEPPALRKTQAGVAVDFSSMAKGFAADEVAELIGKAGAARCFVRIGGDIAARGTGWRVGLERADESAGGVATTLTLPVDGAVSTSGNYRNAVLVRGRRVGHIIDPRSGQPVESSLTAVSVIDASCAASSAWATALFVLGPEAGLAVAHEKGIAALFQVREGGRWRMQPSRAFARLMGSAPEPRR